MSQQKLAEVHHVRPQWRSRMGFILAAIGSAVGLGNIWRFSYLCYKNGGGAFLIPYLIALFIVGIPLMILELGIGHKMRGSAPMTLARVDRHWEWCGWWAVICAMFGIMLYYSAVIAWCLNYVFYSFDLHWGADTNDFFFNTFLQKSDSPGQIGDIRTPIILSLLAVWIMSWFIVYFGIQKGVERANKIFMPVLLGLILILVIWSVNLKGAAQGIAVYLKPNFKLLSKPQIWIDAFSQIFFTLSLAFGIMIAYASYLPRKVDIVKDAIIISVSNCAFSFLAGFAVFGTLGYMAYATNQPVADVVTQSIGLAFVAYPKAISLMPAFSKLFGVLFFSSLVIAGLSSAISLVEAFTCAIIDKFQYKRRTVVSVVCILGFIGSIIFTTQAGLLWLDIVDHFLLQYGLVVVGILECILIGWIYKSSKLRVHINNSCEELQQKGIFKVALIIFNKGWKVCIKFISPAVLIYLLLNNISKEIAEPYGGYSRVATIMIGRDWLLGALILGLFIAMRPWKKELEDK